jgi:tetratricopeptide (TPR) repeat protein
LNPERRPGWVFYTAPSWHQGEKSDCGDGVTEKEENLELRCGRCGQRAPARAKFCSECGSYLREQFIEQHLLLALAHEREGRGKEARQELLNLLDADPNHVLANHLLGSFYFHEGSLEPAIHHYEISLAGAPKFVLGYYDLGLAWYHRGNMLEAAKAFQRCLEIDPGYKAAHYRLALALFHSGRLEEARSHFEQSILITPDYLMAHYHLGIIYERRGELEAAANAFERSWDESIGEVSGLYHLAMIRRAQGDEAGANKLLQRVREFDQTAKAGG